MSKFKRGNKPKVNATVHQLPTVNEANQLKALASVLMGRAAVAARLGKSFGTTRDLYAELGYTQSPVFDDYYSRYERQDVASRIIKAPVNATWREKPEVTDDEDPKKDTPFKVSWAEMVKDLTLYRYLSRADKISGIGQYGVLVMGFDDGKPFSEEVESAKELLYVQPYTENSARINTWEDDNKNKRFGLPKTYTIEFSRADKQKLSTLEVHHSRVIHIAEDLDENDVYGTPRLRPVLNRLEDLERVSGGSAEMYWRGAFPGFGVKNDEGAEMAQDLTALEDELEEYVHGLRRYIKLQNMSIENFALQVADPSKHVDILIQLISSATGIPKRILTGSERGELASSQDKENWADRIDERKRDHGEFAILRPFINSQIAVGTLEKPKNDEYEIKWPDSHTETEKEVAEVSEIQMKALGAYVNALGADLIVPPEIFLKKYLKWTDDEIEQSGQLVDEMRKKELEEINQPMEPEV